MGNLSNSDQEDMAILHVGMLLAPVVLASGGIWLAAGSTRVGAWLVEHRWLAAPDQALIPLGSVAGLDAVRILGVLALIVFLLMCVVLFRPRKG